MEEAAERLPCRDLRQGEAGSRVTRRLVQSTLFPQSTRDYNADDCKEEDEEDEGIKDENEHDWCNSSKKRQKKSSQGKTNNNSKVTMNGKEISNKKVDNVHSPVIMKSDFFMKISERKQQKRQQEDQLCVFSNEENGVSCLSPNSAANIRTPKSLRQRPNLESDKQQAKGTTTPKKKMMNSGAKKSLIKRSPSESVPDKQTMQFFPNLRSEAKMTAEENSRLFARRPIHPFFSSWKASKRNQEITEMDNTCCFLEGKEEATSFNPIHVFEADKDDASSLDWGELMFSEEGFPNFGSGLGSVSEISERSINSLQFDDFPAICYPSTTLTCQNKMFLDKCPYEDNEGNGIERFDSVQVLPSCQNSDADKFLQQSECNVPENSLWTDKYQPRKAAEICGNGESVKFISEWLCLWHEKGSQTHKTSLEDEKNVEDVDYSCSPSDADSENADGETSLKNVLLVTGPVGCGKSAAVYACAEEQGFQIIEVNASDWRNGALVKQIFGEALESHWLQRKVDNMALAKSIPGITKVNEGSKKEVVELIQLSDEEDSQQAYQNSCWSIGRQNMDALKTLIFFEDVDATLNEDHGLLSTIQQLAQTAKRPMILTTNKYNPPLLHNLDRLEVQFKMPLLKELICLGRMVCAAENAQIHACLMDRLIKYCRSDIRKTILHLQFWCQSQNLQKGDRPKVAYSPFLFDIEAGHELLPKLISWSCPSQLSELIEEEINKSLVIMEKSNNLVEIVVEEETYDKERQNGSRMCGTTSDCYGTKEEMLWTLNHSLQIEDDLLSQPYCNSQFSDISSSPVAFVRQNVRRRHGVISSDSEQENFYQGTPFSSCGRVDTNCRVQSLTSNSPSYSLATERCYLPNRPLSPFDAYELEQRSISCPETAVSPCVNSMSNLADVSTVPESLAIPKTEAINEIGLFSATVSYGTHVCTEDVDSMRNYLSPRLPLTECEKLCNSMHKDGGTPGSYSDSDMTTLHTEIIGDSPNVHGEDVSRVYQELDECSRCDFARMAKGLEKPSSYWHFNNVEETWRRLRNSYMELKQHVTPEQKDVSHGLKLASGMTDLISEADLLLSYCQPHVCDWSESSVSFHEKTHLYRWYDDQMQMSSIFSEHAICFYAKEASVLEANRSCCDQVDLALEMLSSSTNSMSLGKLLTLDKKIIESIDLRTPINGGSRRSCKNDSSLCNVLQSVVSSRAYLALQGNAFHEYLSSLSHISRSEALNFSEFLSARKQRRKRTAGHYLSSGTYSLSPEDISLLRNCNSYGKSDIHV